MANDSGNQTGLPLLGDPINNQPSQIAVLVIFYTRTDNLRTLISHLQLIRPRKIYFASDGPKSEMEADLVSRCRHIISSADWDCDVELLYSDLNLGLSQRNLTAVDTVMATEEGVLVLEDDCIPRPQILRYVQTVLERESENKLLGVISCFNPLGDTRFLSRHAYFMSPTFRPWGFYISKQKWRLYREFLEGFDVSTFSILRELSVYKGLLNKVLKYKILRNHAASLSHGDILMQSFFRRQGLVSAMPSISQVVNIGSGPQATHTGFMPKYLMNNLSSPIKLLDFSKATSSSKSRGRLDILEGWFYAAHFPAWVFFRLKKRLGFR